MKISKLLFAAFIVLVFIPNTFARQPERSRQSWEQLRARKISFITEKIQLTPEEAQKFWPIYNQSEKENWDVQSKRHDIDKQVQNDTGKLSDKAIIKLTRDLVDTYKQEALVKEKYNEQFLKVLPPGKVLKLYQAEDQFTFQMLRDFRNRDRDHRPDNNSSNNNGQ
jgi:hypothetical protein